MVRKRCVRRQDRIRRSTARGGAYIYAPNLRLLMSSVRTLLPLALALLVAGCQTGATGTDALTMTVYKTPTCGCCALWVEHLEANGFTVEVVDMPDLSPVKAQYGIPNELQSCHTGVIGDYVVEGHVPAEDVRRLLEERPDAGGLAVPGMPIGSPGMEVPDGRVDSYAVFLVGDDGGTSVFARHGDTN